MIERVYKYYNKYVREVAGFCYLFFPYIPEETIAKDYLGEYFPIWLKVFFIRICVLTISASIYYFWLYKRNSIYIDGENYRITVEYGDLFNENNCKKVIPFDECFTTTTGKRPCDINPESICGQYLLKHKINEQEMEDLIKEADLKAMRSKSSYKNNVRYESGTLVPRGDDLLLSFAKLDKDGLGVLSRDEYLQCLSLLWHEINKYHGQKDVCVPILGSGITRMGDKSPTQQELLDIMILTYKLCACKLKNPNRLRIICRKQEGFSLEDIGKTI